MKRGIEKRTKRKSANKFFLWLFFLAFSFLALSFFFSHFYQNDLKLITNGLTGNVVASPKFIAVSLDNDYTLKEVLEVQDYLWHMATINNTVYSGTYGRDNYIYSSSSPLNQWDKIQITTDTQESTRVYNLNGRLYATAEGGFVWADGEACYNLNSEYLVAAAYYNGKYLVMRIDDPSSKTKIYDCPCSSQTSVSTQCTSSTQCVGRAQCTSWVDVSGIAVFDAEEYKGNLYLVGCPPGNCRTSNAGKVYKINSQGGIEQKIKDGGVGTGTRALKFDDKIFFGFSYDAQIMSYDGLNLKSEISFPGIKHFGDFEVFDGKLFVVVVSEPGSAEIYYRTKDSLGGAWKKVFSQEQLSKYGCGPRALVNPAGFFTVYEDKLFLNINNKINIRRPPGYILEITKILPDCTQQDWNFSLSPSICSSSQKQTKIWIKNRNCSGGYSPASLIENISCSSGNLVLNCTEENWNSTLNPVECPNSGVQVRTWIKNGRCTGGIQHPEEEEISCTRQNIFSSLFSDSDNDGVNDAYDKCPDTFVDEDIEINRRGCPMPQWDNFKQKSSDLRFKDLKHVTGFKLATEEGSITFKEPVSLLTDNNSIDLDGNVLIEKNKVFVDEENLPELDKKALLFFNNLSVEDPVILKDGVECSECKLIEHNDNQISIEVPHFTLYEVIEREDYELLASENSAAEAHLCFSNWSCNEWSSCINGLKERTCEDINDCNSSEGQPAEEETCEALTESCSPDWECTDWDPKICTENENQTRECRDVNKCNKTQNIPEENKICAYSEQNNDGGWFSWKIILLTVFIILAILAGFYFLKKKKSKNEDSERSGVLIQQRPLSPPSRQIAKYPQGYMQRQAFSLPRPRQPRL